MIKAAAAVWLVIVASIWAAAFTYPYWRLPPKPDHVTIQFNMPHCHKSSDGVVECTMRRLGPERIPQ